MAVTGIKNSKVTMYKMVSLPTTASGTKDSGMKASQLSYKAFTTGLNRIGATINSTIVINNQIKSALIANLKLKDKEFEEERKRFQKEKEEKNKVVKKSGGFPSFGVGKAAEKVAGGFLEGLLGLGGALMKFVITQSVLRWMGNPANIQKLITIVQTIVNVVTFFARFLRDNIVKMFDGLATMLDGKKNIFEKLGGFVTFITGFGAVLGAALILKKPGMVLKGVGWVLKTLYTSLFKTKTRLAKQVASGAGSGFGSWSSQAGKGAKGGGGGRLGSIAKGAAAVATIAVPMVVGAQMASGPDEFSGAPGSVSAGGGGDSGGGGTPHLAMGGVATRPTSALIGEAGPELRMPLDNAKRMRDSGIKPLSSLGGMFKGGGDQKQAKKLSDLFMAPFRGIGAGILANVSQVVSGMPGGQALTPILGNIITPIANSFGVPPSLVKTLTSKTSSQGKGKGLKSKKDDTAKIFGKGKLVKVDDKKFKRVADTSVLGLLSNMLAAVQVIGNKVGGKGTTDTPTTTPAPSDSGPAPDQPKSGAQKSSGGGGTNTASETIKKAGGLKEDGTVQGVKGETTAVGRGGGKQFSPGAGLLPVEGSDRKLWYNASGDIFAWSKPGDPLTDITSGGDKQMMKGYVKGTLVRDLSTGKVKVLTGGLLAGFGGGDQTPVGYFNYMMGAVLKKRGKTNPKGAKDKDEWEKPTNGLYGPTIEPKTPSKKAAGGWISGPMSGYPVSLSEGGATDFIGHGTEWVGFKKAAGGSAFVVPFDTPATKNNPGLTGSRMRQAKQGGYALPGYAKGGEVKDPKGSGDKGLKTDTSGGAVITSKYGPRWGRFHAGVDLAGVPIGTPITSLTGGKVLYASTYSGYGNTVDLEVKPGKVLRFAHLDGFLVKQGDVIKPGTKIGTLGNTGIGTGPHLHYEHRNKLSFGQDGSFNPLETGALADISIGGKPIVGAKAGQQTEEDKIKLEGQDPPETFEGLMSKLQSAVGALNTSLGYAPPANSVDKATADASKAKADKDKAAKEASAKASADAVKSMAGKAKDKRVQNQPVASKPVMLPGPTTIAPIEIVFAPTTSLYQPKVTFA